LTASFLPIVETMILLLEAVGVLVILGGFVIATVIYLRQFRSQPSHPLYVAYRRRSVRGLILGLEFLVAADIIKTVTTEYNVQSVLMLGLIVLIRTFLVFALHLEIDGRLPWVKPERKTSTDDR
jgi:uncharacterized membrane protein